MYLPQHWPGAYKTRLHTVLSTFQDDVHVALELPFLYVTLLYCSTAQSQNAGVRNTDTVKHGADGPVAETWRRATPRTTGLLLTA